MEYIVNCSGRKYITKNKYFHDYAMSLSDNGNSLSNPRLRFIINMEDNFRIETKNKPKKKVDNTIGSLYPLSKEMNKTFLSSEDEEWLDDILGPDPYTPLY